MGAERRASKLGLHFQFVVCLNPLSPKSVLKILSIARRFYSSKGDPLGLNGLKSCV